jgi:hypothetical protein
MRVQIQLRIVSDDDTVLSEDVIACFDKGDDQREQKIPWGVGGWLVLLQASGLDVVSHSEAVCVRQAKLQPVERERPYVR